MTTIIDVAKRASVSIATVSNVIRGTKKVGAERRERIQTNAHARNGIAGYHESDLHRHHSGGGRYAAFERDYFLVTVNTDKQIGRERRLLNALRSYRADGIVLASAPGAETSHIRNATAAGIAVVYLDRLVACEKADAVLLDNESGARECVRHLLHLGHRRIAIITGPLALQNARDRLQGYEKELRKSDVQVNPKLIFQGDYRLASGYNMAKELLRSKVKLLRYLYVTASWR